MSLVLVVGSACSSRGETRHRSHSTTAPALPVDRIAVVGASVSAGFGGRPFGDVIREAAPRSNVASYANVLLFREPVADAHAQIDRAIAFRASAIVAVDLMFWMVYAASDDAWRERAIASVLGDLERARAAGAWIIVGDVPHVVTASELLIPRDAVPDAKTIARHNAVIAAWAKGREHVLLVPFAAWAEPLAAGGEVEIAPGERVPARDLVSLDGLHVNRLGTWALLDRLDHLIETSLPGTPKDALVFARPSN